jgi:hypothetical protein
VIASSLTRRTNLADILSLDLLVNRLKSGTVKFRKYLLDRKAFYENQMQTFGTDDITHICSKSRVRLIEEILLEMDSLDIR